MINKIRYLIILGLSLIAFIFLIIPIAIFLKLMKFDLLRKRLYNSKTSYWINNNENNQEKKFFRYMWRNLNKLSININYFRNNLFNIII